VPREKDIHACHRTKNSIHIMNFTTIALPIFEQAIEDYHRHDDVNTPVANPRPPACIEHDLYLKCWIDTVQWHLEDIIRDPLIDPLKALEIKRAIDKSNQDRTDLVERVDSYFLHLYRDTRPAPSATINTESPAWAIDRLSILALKIVHMREETLRDDVDDTHRAAAARKLAILLEQRADLATAIDRLLDDIAAGRKYMKVYKQMKMYNDPTLNPVLYKNK
jgi:hypothetical protein